MLFVKTFHKVTHVSANQNSLTKVQIGYQNLVVNAFRDHHHHQRSVVSTCKHHAKSNLTRYTKVVLYEQYISLLNVLSGRKDNRKLVFSILQVCRMVKGVPKCACPGSYSRDPTTNACTVINECQFPQLNDCHPNAECIDQPNSYTCRCRQGFMDISPKDKPGRSCQPCKSCLQITCLLKALSIVVLVALFV